MANSARVLTKYIDVGGVKVMHIQTLAAPVGVSFTDVTNQDDTYLTDGDGIVVQIDGLSAAQLTALKARVQIITLLEKADTDDDFTDGALTKTDIQNLVTLINNRFSVPLAKIRAWLDENDVTMTKKKAEAMIRRLCTAVKKG